VTIPKTAESIVIAATSIRSLSGVSDQTRSSDGEREVAHFQAGRWSASSVVDEPGYLILSCSWIHV
jgi:hypothetical protein